MVDPIIYPLGFDDPPAFPAWTVTNETPPRWIKLLGTAAMDPDVWVAEIEGESAWVVKGSGLICHKTIKNVKALPWPKGH